jgi:hypothetical protein
MGEGANELTADEALDPDPEPEPVAEALVSKEAPGDKKGVPVPGTWWGGGGGEGDCDDDG